MYFRESMPYLTTKKHRLNPTERSRRTYISFKKHKQEAIMNLEIYNITAPNGKTVLHRLKSKEKTEGGIYFPVEQESFMGEVINTHNPELKRGDIVMFYKTIDVTSLIIDKSVEIAIVSDKNIFATIDSPELEEEAFLQQIEVK